MQHALYTKISSSLRAQIVARESLVYAARQFADLPLHVRAASGLVWLDEQLAIIQDDNHFVSLRAKNGGLCAVPLPPGADGRRRFEDALSNKRHKHDLEAITVLPIAGQPTLVAFGSGATPTREKIVLIEPQRPEHVALLEATAFYQGMRSALGGAALQLNIEGATPHASHMLLFHRSTSRTTGCATAFIAFALDSVVAWLEAKGSGAAPAPRAVTFCDLGNVEGVPYGFTDASSLDAERCLFLAAAEDTSDPVNDGRILGTRVGLLRQQGDQRELVITDLLDESGQPARVKAEGIAPCFDGTQDVWIVLDSDNPDVPAELCRVALQGT